METNTFALRTKLVTIIVLCVCFHFYRDNFDDFDRVGSINIMLFSKIGLVVRQETPPPFFLEKIPYNKVWRVFLILRLVIFL
jgi:hypothetical protein